MPDARILTRRLDDARSETSCTASEGRLDGGDTVAVDAVGRYVDATGAAAAVSSCDIFEFRAGLVHQITPCTVEVDPAATPAR